MIRPRAWSLPRLRRYEKPLGHLISAASVGLLALTLFRVWAGHEPGFGDVYAYWLAWENGLYDAAAVGAPHSYLYSPAFAQVIWPATLLPFEPFYALLLAANVAALVWLVGLRWAGWTAAIFYPVTLELAVGNIHLLLAASIAGSLRHPALWAFPLLTKVTPGVGVAWHLVRGDLKGFAVAVITTGTVVVLSVTISAFGHPSAWIDWIGVLATNRGATDPWALTAVPLLFRLPLAIGIAVFAGWRGWAWLVPVAALISLPVIWLGGLVLLLASWRLARDERGVPAKTQARRQTASDPVTGQLA